jgi:hypothetical protein
MLTIETSRLATMLFGNQDVAEIPGRQPWEGTQSNLERLSGCKDLIRSMQSRWSSSEVQGLWL